MPYRMYIDEGKDLPDIVPTLQGPYQFRRLCVYVSTDQEGRVHVAGVRRVLELYVEYKIRTSGRENLENDSVYQRLRIQCLEERVQKK